MNNLHRELAPISDAAWAQIEEEASRTLKRYLAARRVVDVEGPARPHPVRRRHRASEQDRGARRGYPGPPAHRQATSSNCASRSNWIASRSTTWSVAPTTRTGSR